MDPFTASTGQAGSGDTDTLVFSGSPVSRAGTPLTEERRLEPQTSVSLASVQANTKRVIGQFECAIPSGNLLIRSQSHNPPPCHERHLCLQSEKYGRISVYRFSPCHNFLATGNRLATAI